MWIGCLYTHSTAPSQVLLHAPTIIINLGCATEESSIVSHKKVNVIIEDQSSLVQQEGFLQKQAKIAPHKPV